MVSDISLIMYFTYPVVVNGNFFFPHRISVYFILFGLSISPFFDVTSLTPLVKEECKGKTIARKYTLNWNLYSMREVRVQ